MNARIAFGILALAVMFAGSANAEKLADGAKVKFSNSKHKSADDGAMVFVLRKQGDDRGGDGIFHLERADERGVYLYASNKVGDSVGYSKAPCKWVLHKNSTGWSIMLRENGALAVSINKDGKKELQRNQGASHQVWQR